MKTWSLASRFIRRSFQFGYLEYARGISSSSSWHQLHLISTPIFYVNAVPHIGHLYSAVLADYAHRYRVLKGETDGVFSTGTDEHGLKIQRAAATAGKASQQFCDCVSREFKKLFDATDVAYTDFIRTTETRHKIAVKHFWENLSSKGWISEGHYEGWYSTSDETFLPETQITDGVGAQGEEVKVSIDSGHPVEWTTETNYLFRLSQFQDQLLHWLDTNPEAVHPPKFHAMVKSWIEEGLWDISVSRQRNRLEWGIPVPGNDSQTIYVWLDALINYLTVCGYPGELRGWPGINIVGKDILKFHAIYWPAFLMAAGLEPPKSIVCHSHWTMDNHKMSKSRGNVVDPFDQIEKFTSDGLRYFLLREGILHSDGNYSEQKVTKLLNAELADTLGNLLSRVTGRALNPGQVFPPFHEDIFPLDGSRQTLSMATDADYDLVEDLRKLPASVDSHYQSFNANKALEGVMSCLRQANGFINRHQPWELVKDQKNSKELDNTLHVAMETLRICGILLQPIMPQLSRRLLDRLGIPLNCRTVTSDNLEAFIQEGHSLGEDASPLFARIDKPRR